MAFDLNYIKTTLNPSAVPNGSDLIFAYKADGSPAAYTLNEISTFVNGVSQPTWVTDSHQGCRIGLPNDVGASISMQAGVIPYSRVLEDSNYYANPGTIIIPVGVERIQVIAGIKANTTTDGYLLRILRNTQTVSAIKAGKEYGLIVSPPFVVSAGDTITVTSDIALTLSDFSDSNFLSVRAIEKLA